METNSLVVPIFIAVIGLMNWGVALWFANYSYRKRKRNINK